MLGCCLHRNTVHWTFNTYSIAHTISAAVVALGGRTWFIVAPDYAGGRTLRDTTTSFVEGAGGKVLGGNYAAVSHYLKAVKSLGWDAAKASGRAAVDRMKSIPTDDDCFGSGEVRADGRAIHPNYLFQAKSPPLSKGWDDVLTLLATTSAAEAFQPLSQSECRLVRS